MLQLYSGLESRYGFKTLENQYSLIRQDFEREFNN